MQSPVPPPNEFISEFLEVFSGLGIIKGGPILIAIKDGATPYHISAPRRLPIPMFQPLKAELARMKKLEVIRPVNEPTDWCHPIIVVPKPNGTITLCLDLMNIVRWKV